MSSQAHTQDICRKQAHERVETYRRYNDKLNDEELSDEEREAIEEEFAPLSIEGRLEIRIHLSWGGPSDGFLITFNQAGREVLHGAYFYADWFTYAEEPLSQQDAQMVADLLLGDDISRFFEK